jgi:hypothetical protein
MSLQLKQLLGICAAAKWIAVNGLPFDILSKLKAAMK